ncbi:putative abortive infection phage resistance protein [Actinokineospora globicatena]|uniref:Abortive infection phage resistance protein n=1 Tax=Actinokineospora globicatena TaxID=103729 RepID=A0A9W6QQW7_9PSEU|nr:putative abortive infection phage resistance protein [Actinokineospora globicatena]
MVDGRRDQGIDAIAVSQSTLELFLIQAKWSTQGTAGVDSGAAHKIVDGFRQIESHDFGRFNERVKRKSEMIKSMLLDSRTRVILVFAVMGNEKIAPEVGEILESAKSEYNGYDPLLDYRTIGGTELLALVKDELNGPDISLVVRMSQWLRRHEPTDSFQGSVPAEEVADWYEKFKDRLFDQNVRNGLGSTSVNQAMITTLRYSPEMFWSRNNGITILCSQITPTYPAGSRRRPDQQVDLEISKASVVNGAQTVTAIHTAYQTAAEQVGDAEVSVRVIQIPEAGDEFATRITRSTNTQNHMERRDFIALDPRQAIIRDDFNLTLNKVYVFKRGGMEPASDVGCSVEHAATALACAHRNAELVARIKRNPDLLWEEGPTGAYTILFGNIPSATEIWRSVQLFRTVSDTLRQQSGKHESRASAVADHGDLLVAHIAFQLAGIDALDKNEEEWEFQIQAIRGQVGQILDWLVHEVDRLFTKTSFIGSTFSNIERCKQLTNAVMHCMTSGAPLPPMTEYQSSKANRPRARAAVQILLDADRIRDGATLDYVPSSDRERAAMKAWIGADPRRSKATWVLDRKAPLRWAADGQQYSPSRLVMHMWDLAGWTTAPVAIQGPKCWYLGVEGSLVELASQVQKEELD